MKTVPATTDCSIGARPCVPRTVLGEICSLLLMGNIDLALEGIPALERVQEDLEIGRSAATGLSRVKLVEGCNSCLHMGETMAGASRSDIDDTLVPILPGVLDSVQRKRKISNLLGKMSRDGATHHAGSLTRSRRELS